MKLKSKSSLCENKSARYLVEEPEGGVEGEGGGEDEGGEGVALCKSVEGEEPASTRADFALKLIHQS